MATLTKAAEERIVGLLLAEGLADSNLVLNIKNETDASGGSVLAELKKRGAVNDEMVSHATAIIIGVPYVELKNITIEQDILTKIPYDAQRRTMAVPLGEKDGVLNVAMVDVTNVQNTDYLSNLLGRPIRVWMSSERGVREMLEKITVIFLVLPRRFASRAPRPFRLKNSKLLRLRLSPKTHQVPRPSIPF